MIVTQDKLERLLERQVRGAEKGRFIGAKKQQQERIEKTKKLLKLGMEEVGLLNKRDRFIAGIAPCLGDGSKTDKAVGFSNSNPDIIKFMIKWFREFCKVFRRKSLEEQSGYMINWMNLRQENTGQRLLEFLLINSERATLQKIKKTVVK